MSTTPITTTGLTGTALWLAIGGLFLLGLLAASVRTVSADHLAVVRRFGQVVRVSGPGILLHLPGLHHITLVPRLAVHCPLVVPALTRDGVHVHLIATAVCRIVDPARSGGSPDPLGPAALAVESALAHWVGQTELAQLLQARAEAELHLPRQVSQMTAEWGVKVLEIEVSTIETQLTADLMRLVHGPGRNGPDPR